MSISSVSAACRLTPLVLLLAACDPEVRVEYVEVPAPPPSSVAPPVGSPPPILDLSIDVAASQITGPITLNGAPFPANAAESADVMLYGAHPEDVFRLGSTTSPDYARFVVNGTYDFRYRFESGGALVPRNALATILDERAISADEAIPLAVTSVTITPTFTLNGGPFPASQYDYATFYLRRVGTEELVFLGASHSANAPVRVLAGNYDVIYDYETGSVSPINKRARVVSNIALNASRTLPVDVVASTVRSTFRLNGNPFPQSQYDDATFHLRDKVTGAESLLGNSHASIPSRIVIDGTYDVVYRHEDGDQVPINTAAVVRTDFVVNGAAALAQDIAAVTIGANVTLNGAPFPQSQYEDGVISLYDPQTETDTPLGNTHAPFTNLMLIPGTYDVLYSHETGAGVPQNVRGKVAEGVTISNATLNVNVVGVRVGASVTLNGAPFPKSQYDDANLFLSGAQSEEDILVGNTHDQDPSVMVLPGTYDLYYRHETGDEVPQNKSFKLIAARALASNTTLTADVKARLVRLSATLNHAPFPKNLMDSARIFARSGEGDDVLMARTHGSPQPRMLIGGAYEFYYRHAHGAGVPQNEWAKVAEGVVQ